MSYRIAYAMTVGLVGAAALAQQARSPQSQPDTNMGLYTPRQHELYDGRFVIAARGFTKPER